MRKKETLFSHKISESEIYILLKENTDNHTYKVCYESKNVTLESRLFTEYNEALKYYTLLTNELEDINQDKIFELKMDCHGFEDRISKLENK